MTVGALFTVLADDGWSSLSKGLNKRKQSEKESCPPLSSAAEGTQSKETEHAP